MIAVRTWAGGFGESGEDPFDGGDDLLGDRSDTEPLGAFERFSRPSRERFVEHEFPFYGLNGFEYRSAILATWCAWRTTPALLEMTAFSNLPSAV